MTKIFVPDTSFSCYVVYDKDTIRAYHTQPYYDSYIDYTDYYINSHYLERTGVYHFTNYSTLPTCLSASNLTDDFYYRNDLSDIFVIFDTMAFFGILIPLLLFKKLYKRKSL